MHGDVASSQKEAAQAGGGAAPSLPGINWDPQIVRPSHILAST